MNVRNIIEATGGKLHGKGSHARVQGISWDSRAVEPGQMYVAIVGENVDGHDYAAAAVENGATCVLAEKPLDIDAPMVIVDDVMAAVQSLAGWWRSRLDAVVIGVTGSAGKTSTKNLIRDVLTSEYDVVATKANQNNELGVPATILAASEGTEYIVVEMGMRGADQISALCEFVRPDWGVITNIGDSHLELLGSRENVARAKAELFAALPDDGIAFMNADDPMFDVVMESAGMDGKKPRVVLYSGSKQPRFDKLQAGVWADNVKLDPNGHASFTARNVTYVGSSSIAPCKLVLYGKQNVPNACCAIAVGVEAGLDLWNSANAAAQSKPEGGRQAIVEASEIKVIDDSYNASPASVASALDTLSAISASGRKIAVLGDMLELGDRSVQGHRDCGTAVAKAGIDALVCVGGRSADILSSAVESGFPKSMAMHVDDAETALGKVIGFARPGDVVLVKASHSIGLDRVVSGLVEKFRPVGIEIRTGGQSGADRGALDAARDFGAEISGWCPKGGWAEDFPTAPGLLSKYPELVETDSAEPIMLTEWNIRDSDACIVIDSGDGTSPGTEAGMGFFKKYDVPFKMVPVDELLYESERRGETIDEMVSWVRDLISHHEGKTFVLGVGGPRASEDVRVYGVAYHLVSKLLEKLA